MSHWFDRIGVTKSSARQCVGLHSGLYALTVDPDGTHIVWIMGYALHTGTREQIRPLYADTMRGDWLERFYR